MAILKPDKIIDMGGVTVNEFLLTSHNPNKIDMPTAKINGWPEAIAPERISSLEKNPENGGMPEMERHAMRAAI